MLAKALHASTVRMLIRIIMFFVTVATSARLLIPHMLPHDRLQASQRVLNFGTIGNLLSGELVPAQTAGQVCPKLKLPYPDLEYLPTVRTG